MENIPVDEEQADEGAEEKVAYEEAVEEAEEFDEDEGDEDPLVASSSKRKRGRPKKSKGKAKGKGKNKKLRTRNDGKKATDQLCTEYSLLTVPGGDFEKHIHPALKKFDFAKHFVEVTKTLKVCC